MPTHSAIVLNTGGNYEMGETILCKTVKQTDVGVTLNVFGT